MKKKSEVKLKASSEPEFVVGIGASAGGLNALEIFFDNMPSDSSMAFVIIQHLSPDFKSLMEDLLSRHTKMKIYKVTNGISLKPDSIYLIPPKTRMTISKNKLYLTDKDSSVHLEMPIDIFFNSLAEDMREKAVAIVLSGTGSDGSRGIVSVHEKNGLVLVQSIESAQFDGMPKNAIDTKCYNIEAEPKRMPEILMDYIKNTEKYKKLLCQSYPSDNKLEGKYSQLFFLLQKRFNLDFSIYKPPTIGRRISRRIDMCGLVSLEDYTGYIKSNPAELDNLYSDLLIGVTEFFRDKKAFDIIENKVIPDIIKNSDPENGIRVWSAGCATGEEPYSLAILFYEKIKELNYSGKVTIFATDVNKNSLDFASAGAYEISKLKNISPEKIARYFKKESDGRYKINGVIRKLVVFAPHNIINDPPFTKIDMVCCRNLLIYLSQEMQEKIISLFHFSLRMNGYIFQGSSEGLGKYCDEFKTISNQEKIFQKIRDLKIALNFNQKVLEPHRFTLSNLMSAGPARLTVNIDKQLINDYDYILKNHSPAGFLLNENHHLIHCFGDLHDFVRLPEGRIENDILKLVCPALNLPLNTALIRALKTKKGVSALDQAIKGFSGKIHNVDIFVDCICDEKNKTEHYHVYFKPVIKDENKKSRRPASKIIDISSAGEIENMKNLIASLEYDLQLTRENLQATVEELQTSNEELQATNEELLAANEEMQSTNEELHSVNEELYTVNSEFEFKNKELKQLNQDHDNLLASIDIGTVFLDRQLKIRKFNPAISQFFKLLPQDIGRPIDHIAYHISEQRSMIKSLKKVLKKAKPIEREIKTVDGKTLLKKIAAFKTETGALDGVVLTFTDISVAKESENKIKQLNCELEKRVEERTNELKKINERLIKEIEAKEITKKQLIKAKADAESADRAKSAFLANVSHEIRTPMNAVIGFTEMLSNTELTAEQAESLNYIKISGQSLMALINDILDFSKIEANKLELENIEFDIHRIANEAARVHKIMAADKNLNIAVKIDEKIDFTVFGDPDRLRQVLQNLLSNAVKFTEKGNIELDIKLLTRQSGRALLKIGVKDDGIGISVDNVKKLFNRFTQLNDSSSKKYAGTGLGLAISNQLVKLMGASALEVKSIINEGSEIYFKINFDTGEDLSAFNKSRLESETDLSAVQNQRDGSYKFKTRPLKILLAEDNLINTALAVKLLNKMGHSVISVTNGGEAVYRCSTERFDLIILDVQMPIMDGFEAAAEIRKAGIKIPVIALTAGAMKGDRELCEKAGMNAYITKPINKNILEKTICEQINNFDKKFGDKNPADVISDDKNESNQELTLIDEELMILDYNLLRSNLGDAELMRDAAKFLIEGFHGQLKDILSAWKHDELKPLKSFSHKLKGTAANACARSIVRRLEALEKLNEGSWSAEAKRIINEIIEEYEKYRIEAAKYGLV